MADRRRERGQCGKPQKSIKEAAHKIQTNKIIQFLIIIQQDVIIKQTKSAKLRIVIINRRQSKIIPWCIASALVLAIKVISNIV